MLNPSLKTFLAFSVLVFLMHGKAIACTGADDEMRRLLVRADEVGADANDYYRSKDWKGADDAARCYWANELLELRFEQRKFLKAALRMSSWILRNDCSGQSKNVADRARKILNRSIARLDDGNSDWEDFAAKIDCRVTAD